MNYLKYKLQNINMLYESSVNKGMTIDRIHALRDGDSRFNSLR